MNNTANMKHEKCLILKNRRIAPDIYELILHAPGIAVNAKPGQFVMVHLDKGELLLPRPISICSCKCEDITLVYKVLGSGTKYISTLPPGMFLRLTGPLGNGFTIKKGQTKVALIGGGIGIPPMVMLHESLKIADGFQTDVLLGFNDESFLTDRFPKDNVYIATQSGKEGIKGNVIDLLNNLNQPYDEMYACGPKAMLAALAQYAKAKAIPLQVSLEERMACGVGTCMGCVTPPKYMKICCDGPVFYSDKVVLDE
ncbi:MAG: dihydroorotate dehydrogenase electron transfer subunit [Defluviitaleaceae bacterium]|nr:dihydroorotate dehydrogenase electron transfer subunit [Defluviitaleaceae bacterium]